MSRATVARARAGRTRRIGKLPRAYAGTLMVMLYGSAIAVLVVAAGLGALLTEGVKSRPAERAVANEKALDSKPAATPAHINISARNLGDLRLGIQARVTMNRSRSALQQAHVQAYLDMVQMPQAHTLGPLTLKPADRPGLYSTVTTVPMLGDYKIRVEMHEPVRAKASEVVPVDVISGGK